MWNYLIIFLPKLETIFRIKLNIVFIHCNYFCRVKSGQGQSAESIWPKWLFQSTDITKLSLDRQDHSREILGILHIWKTICHLWSLHVTTLLPVINASIHHHTCNGNGMYWTTTTSTYIAWSCHWAHLPKYFKDLHPTLEHARPKRKGPPGEGVQTPMEQMHLRNLALCI